LSVVMAGPGRGPMVVVLMMVVVVVQKLFFEGF
jgi:hypothetical protein